MLPSTKDVIGYLNRDIFELRLIARETERDCDKDPNTCGGCEEMQKISKALIDYTRVVNYLKVKGEIERLEMMKENG